MNLGREPHYYEIGYNYHTENSLHFSINFKSNVFFFYFDIIIKQIMIHNKRKKKHIIVNI